MPAPDLSQFRVLTLEFRSPEEEAAFAIVFARRSVRMMRIVLLLGCTLYALFGVLDMWIIPEAVHTIWGIRAAVCASMLLVYALSHAPRFLTASQAWMIAMGMVTGFGIVAMVLVADVRGGYHYYAGLLLVIPYAHGLMRLRFINATLVNGMVLTAYAAVAIVVKETPAPILVNNFFFLLSASVLGMFTSYALELNHRRVFLQQRMVERQRSDLQAEHDRKTRDLEAARRLQQSMLPQSVPEHPLVEIAAALTTATEVGGDYYDFWVDDGGTLTVALGDATGHGSQAGAMVAAAKVLLGTLMHEADIRRILERASAPLSSVGSAKVYMSLALVRLRGCALELAGAGMPPALVYRAATGEIEEIPMKGLPLGSPVWMPSRSTSTVLAGGDTVLLISDGFPELFSPAREMLGYERAAGALKEAAGGSPEEIIGHFTRIAGDWLQDSARQDDMTFVVLRMKAPPTA